jgi:WD40 repeat protein
MVRFVCFSPDGVYIATASSDKTARLWDAASGKPLAVLQGHTGQVMSVCFSADGARVVTASDDGTARVWIARESPADQGKRRRFWREQHAASAEEAGQWFAAGFHLSRLIDETPSDDSLHLRRCKSYARRGEWIAAFADLLQGVALHLTGSGRPPFG